MEGRPVYVHTTLIGHITPQLPISGVRMAGQWAGKVSFFEAASLKHPTVDFGIGEIFPRDESEE